MDRMIDSRGVRLATEAFGDPGDPAIVLVMGATASRLGRPDALCAGLSAERRFVVRYDHRDTGASTTRPPGQADYTIEDLADDLVAVLDGHDLPSAHLVGMSLGGYLSQMVALDHPARVASLTLIASEPLGWDGPPLPTLSPAILDHFGALATLDWSDRAAVAAFLLETDRLCAGPRHGFDAAAAAGRIDAVLARTASIASAFNHATAPVARDWTGRFRSIAAPTLVIHGTADSVLPPDNGRALAESISARLHLMEGVGHELPAAEIAGLVGVIAGFTGEVG
jgi:pimeloyl-ACP methyl ester carboxylesterase